MNETYTSNSTFFRKGRYLEQLQAFTKVFDRKQMLIISSIEIFRDPKNVMEVIRKFIDVPPDASFLKSLPHGKLKSNLLSIVVETI